MPRIAITLPGDLSARLKDEPQRQRISVSEAARNLLRDRLLGSDDEPREIPWAGIIDDPDMPAARDMEEYLAGV